MAVVPLPHPDSTVPGRSDKYWLIPVVGARSGPSDSILNIHQPGGKIPFLALATCSFG